jgi:cation transport ATPase
VKGNQAAADQLNNALMRLDAVNQVLVNMTSGSVVIRYDPEQISTELLVAAIIRVLNLESQLDKVPQSVLGREISQMSHALNRTVYDQTKGTIDLRTALLISIAGLGVAKILNQRNSAFPAGFTLLWWAGRGLFSPVEGS